MTPALRNRRIKKKRKNPALEKWEEFVNEAVRVGLIDAKRREDLLGISPTRSRISAIEDFIRTYKEVDEEKREFMRSIFETIFTKWIKKR